MRKILSRVRAALDDYNMIQEGDKIAVGLSGGKDSILTMLALANLRRFYPNKFELIAITLGDANILQLHTSYSIYFTTRTQLPIYVRLKEKKM